MCDSQLIHLYAKEARILWTREHCILFSVQIPAKLHIYTLTISIGDWMDKKEPESEKKHQARIGMYLLSFFITENGAGVFFFFLFFLKVGGRGLSPSITKNNHFECKMMWGVLIHRRWLSLPQRNYPKIISQNRRALMWFFFFFDSTRFVRSIL